MTFGPYMEAARSVLIGVEGMLAEWPSRVYLPSVFADPGGVTVRLDHPGGGFSATQKSGSMLLLERLVQLGVAAAKSIRDYA